MVKAKKETVYICGVCGFDYIDEWDADKCCTEPTTEKIIWRCDNCDSEYDNEHDANECCANQTLPLEIKNKNENTKRRKR